MKKVDESLRRKRSEGRLVRCWDDRDDNSQKAKTIVGMIETRSQNNSVGELGDRRSRKVNTVVEVVGRSRDVDRGQDEDGDSDRDEEFSDASDH